MLVNQDGTLNATNYYYPYGGNDDLAAGRPGGVQSTLTTRRYTGQYHEADIGGGEGLWLYYSTTLAGEPVPKGMSRTGTGLFDAQPDHRS